MTEHAAVIFVFFFLAEYASIVLICILNTVLFIGGYLLNFTYILHILDVIIMFGTQVGNGMGEIAYFTHSVLLPYREWTTEQNSSILEGLSYGLILGIKSCIMIFVFIWVRASFPRIRFDQLMSFSWTILLPIVIAFIVLMPCIIYGFGIIPVNICLF